MTPLLRLKSRLDRSASSDPEDVVLIKSALARIGLLGDRASGITPYPDHGLFEGIRAFQRRRGLTIDGVMTPSGPTLRALNAELAHREDAPAARDAMGDRQRPAGRAPSSGLSLAEPVRRDAAAREHDVIALKTALARLGLYRDPDGAITPVPDGALFQAVETFQRSRRLEVDGVVNPGGETERALAQEMKQQEGKDDDAPSKGESSGGAEGDRQGDGPGQEDDREKKVEAGVSKEDFAKELEDLGYNDKEIESLAGLANSTDPEERRVVRLLREGVTPETAREIAAMGEEETAATIEMARSSASRSEFRRRLEEMFGGITSKLPRQKLPDVLDPGGIRD